MTQQKYFILDIESLGLLPWNGDRLTVIGIRTSNGKEHIFMNQDEQETLKDFHDWFQEQKQDFDFMITKNGKAFDIPFIITRAFINNLDNVAKNLKSTLIPYSHIDLHEITKKWISLDDMARILTSH